MRIVKETAGGESAQVTAQDLELIGALARRALGAEEVYTFSVRLCDNEIDRDFERFTTQTLEELAPMFVGKAGIFDHQWSAKGQAARIYRTEVVREPGEMTRAGDGYCWLKGYAYMVRTDSNRDLIAEIEGGIKKEVSVGCSVRHSVCSICGAEGGGCRHVKGQVYDGKLCFTELRDPADAYEWSFVAVPAQRSAGVLKRFGQEDGQLARLREEAALGRKYLAELRREVVRLAMLADDRLDGGVFARAAERMEEPELLAMRDAYGVQAAKRFPAAPQLRPRPAEERDDPGAFQV